MLVFLKLVTFTAVFGCSQVLEIPRDVETTDVLPLKRNDVIYVVAFRAVEVDQLQGGGVYPRRGRLEFTTSSDTRMCPSLSTCLVKIKLTPLPGTRSSGLRVTCVTIICVLAGFLRIGLLVNLVLFPLTINIKRRGFL
jgi:hypothetical protein